MIMREIFHACSLTHKIHESFQSRKFWAIQFKVQSIHRNKFLDGLVISYSWFKVQVYLWSIDTSCTDDRYQQILTWLEWRDGWTENRQVIAVTLHLHFAVRVKNW